MNHDTEEGWREYVKEELKRISALDDSIGRTLNTVVVGGSVGAIIASINYLKDIAGPNPAAGHLLISGSRGSFWSLLWRSALGHCSRVGRPGGCTGMPSLHGSQRM